jgi:hypothetical protein
VQAYFSGKKVGAPMPVTVTEKDLELKQPIKVDSGGAPASDDKASDDKPKEGAK